MDHPCTVDGCPNQARRRGYCWGHYDRVLRQLPVDVELAPKKGLYARLTPWDRLMEAALVMLEVRPTDQRGWRRARHRLAVAADRYVESKRRRRSPHPH